MVFKINPYIEVELGAAAFAIAIALQILVRKYIPWVYWLAVVMVAVFDTIAADVLHIQFGVPPYLVSSAIFAIVLAIVFSVRNKTEHTLSIHTINKGAVRFSIGLP